MREETKAATENSHGNVPNKGEKLRQRSAKHTLSNEIKNVPDATKQIKNAPAATKRKKRMRRRIGKTPANANTLEQVQTHSRKHKQLALHTSTCKSGNTRGSNKRDEAQLAINDPYMFQFVRVIFLLSEALSPCSLLVQTLLCKVTDSIRGKSMHSSTSRKRLLLSSLPRHFRFFLAHPMGWQPPFFDFGALARSPRPGSPSAIVADCDSGFFDFGALARSPRPGSPFTIVADCDFGFRAVNKEWRLGGYKSCGGPDANAL